MHTGEVRSWPLLRGVENPHPCTASEIQNVVWWRREFMPCEAIAERLEEYMRRCITAVKAVN